MEVSQNLRLAHLQLQMDTSATYKANQTETRRSCPDEHFKCESGAITHLFFIEFSRNLHLAHLQLVMKTPAKYKVNQTETVGGVVRTSIFKSNQGQ